MREVLLHFRYLDRFCWWFHLMEIFSSSLMKLEILLKRAHVIDKNIYGLHHLLYWHLFRIFIADYSNLLRWSWLCRIFCISAVVWLLFSVSIFIFCVAFSFLIKTYFSIISHKLKNNNALHFCLRCICNTTVLQTPLYLFINKRGKMCAYMDVYTNIHLNF